MAPLWDGHQIGDVIATETVPLTRESLVRYAGASGDVNPIHYRDDVAQSVGLEGVLAHGMLTMGLGVGPVTKWLGDRGFVSRYQVRFTKPVYVPATGSVAVTVSVSLAACDDPVAGGATLSLDVAAEDGKTVLGKALVVESPR